ncbi:hypothetical protein BU17DRAFT_87400 [Hysterangium stoloniferum]|nr:hypothetical protein BU17DRAFT_87400 [Hysterangium stoloniferum]
MRFFLGDENGQLKSAKCMKLPGTGWKVSVSLLDDGGKSGPAKAIQIALVRADGSGSLISINDEANSTRVLDKWQDSRFKPGSSFVGLGSTGNSGTISCTNDGHLSLVQHNDVTEDTGVAALKVTSIPNRLCEWQLAADFNSFAYGGEEVEVSVWDTSRAFEPTRSLVPGALTGSKRRKGQNELFDGEIWRAKNVSNDFLNLRQPVHNTTLTYLQSNYGEKGSSQHILAGTRLGSLRRYDTRTARKPVSDWREITRVGGVKKVRQGNSEHEVYAADHGSNLLALDLRTGRVLYNYSGLAGAITSIASTTSSHSPPLLASTSLDRFFRLHSTGVDGGRGDVLAKEWVKTTPSCVVWDECREETLAGDDIEEDEDEGDIWEKMKGVGEEEDLTSSSDADGEIQRENKRRKAR